MFEELGTGEYSVDKIMIPSFGKHSMKQYIKNKPVKYRYKVWSLATSDGVGLTFEPFCGKDSRVEDAGMGQGLNVVKELVSKTNIPKGSDVFTDNLFTSFSILNWMSSQGFGMTGTVRNNRLKSIVC